MSAKNKDKVAIFGAGIKGKSINYTFKIDKFCEYDIVCFIDDDTAVMGSIIDGLEVYSFDQFLLNYKAFGVELVIWAINAHDENGILRKRTVAGLCEKHGIMLKTVLMPNEVLNEIGNTEWNDLYDYILQREKHELTRILDFERLTNKNVLVTGAAGSIGSEICRQLMKLDIEKLIVVDNAETELTALINELSEFGNSCIEFVLGDVRDSALMDKIFSDYRPNVVFHAAAYKHVPMMERFPFSAIDVNFYGTYVIANVAVKYAVENFIQVSTDKSVNPTSVMGATKRLAELLIFSLAQNSKTRFAVTRFGNVIGSRGSAIPIFHEQLRRGKPIRVTHFDIERYFMTIPEAVRLLLLAAVDGLGNGIFLFDMGEPFRIYDVACRMIDYFGLELGKNSSIEIIGLRPGEKMYEELFTENEEFRNESYFGLFKAKLSEIDPLTDKLILDFLDTYRTDRFSNDILKLKIKQIIPEYTYGEDS
jgi:FlaA1/EpsC-like NDP-sugar epimerase